jgi:hypothetical protein
MVAVMTALLCIFLATQPRAGRQNTRALSRADTIYFTCDGTVKTIAGVSAEVFSSDELVPADVPKLWCKVFAAKKILARKRVPDKLVYVDNDMLFDSEVFGAENGCDKLTVMAHAGGQEAAKTNMFCLRSAGPGLEAFGLWAALNMSQTGNMVIADQELFNSLGGCHAKGVQCVADSVELVHCSRSLGNDRKWCMDQISQLALRSRAVNLIYVWTTSIIEYYWIVPAVMLTMSDTGPLMRPMLPVWLGRASTATYAAVAASPSIWAMVWRFVVGGRADPVFNTDKHDLKPSRMVLGLALEMKREGKSWLVTPIGPLWFENVILGLWAETFCMLWLVMLTKFACEFDLFMPLSRDYLVSYLRPTGKCTWISDPEARLAVVTKIGGKGHVGCVPVGLSVRRSWWPESMIWGLDGGRGAGPARVSRRKACKPVARAALAGSRCR